MASQVDVPTGVEIRVTGESQTHIGGGGLCDGGSDTCRDHRCLTACQKQHRQYQPAGRVDMPTGIDRGPCDGGSQKLVGTTDVSPSVKNNTDRMNQLVRQTFLLGRRSV